MKFFATTALATLLLAGAATAGSLDPVVQDPVIAPVPVDPGVDWTGVYFGASYGLVVDGDMFDIGGPWALNNNGSLGSGFLGYRHDFGDFVLGAEVSSTLMVDVFQAAFPTWEFTRLTDIRATAGYEVGPALVYAAGGYTTSAFTPGAGSLTYDGWNAGVGVDFALTDNFFIGGEYIYRSISRTTNRNWTADFSTIQVRAGIRF